VCAWTLRHLTSMINGENDHISLIYRTTAAECSPTQQKCIRFRKGGYHECSPFAVCNAPLKPHMPIPKRPFNVHSVDPLPFLGHHRKKHSKCPQKPSPISQALLSSARALNRSVRAAAAPAPAAHALDRLVLLQLRLGHAADARGVEVGLLGLDAAQAAQLLVPLLLPLGDQERVGVVVLEQPVIQGFRDGGLFVVEVVDVAGALVGDLEDGPENFLPLLAFVGGVLGVFHLGAELEERVFDVVEALWWGLAIA